MPFSSSHLLIYSFIYLQSHFHAVTPNEFSVGKLRPLLFFQFLTECFYAFLFSSANSRFWTLEAATADGGNEAKDANIQTSICIW